MHLLCASCCAQWGRPALLFTINSPVRRRYYRPDSADEQLQVLNNFLKVARSYGREVLTMMKMQGCLTPQPVYVYVYTRVRRYVCLHTQKVSGGYIHGHTNLHTHTHT